MEHERGFTTIQYVVASTMSLLLFILVANLLVDMYERGAVRDALDEGVRAAVSTATSAADCEAKARDVLRSVAAGSALRVVSLTCAREGAFVVARAHVVLHSWLPMLVRDWRLDLRASALVER